MPVFSNVEMANMHFLYGLANGNALEARRMYAQRYPNNRLPCSDTFTKLHIRLQETGTFAKSKNIIGRPRTVRNPQLENQILQIIDQHPETSTRNIADEVNVSNKTVWNILKDNLLYPYHIQRVQHLLPTDYPLRIQYCQWILHKIAINPNFTANILFTDEANFSRHGIMNFHNDHIWADVNPHAISVKRFQQTFSVNVWLGIIDDYLIGPFFLPARLTGETYHHFLENELPLLLEDVPIIIRRRMWFMHDGAPPHFSVIVREFLNNVFPDHWIGRGSPHPWPPRSPGHNPLDFCVWGYLKSLVYTTPILNVQDLQNRIIEGCNVIRNNPGIFERIRQSIRHRADACILAGGGHFENLL